MEFIYLVYRETRHAKETQASARCATHVRYGLLRRHPDKLNTTNYDVVEGQELAVVLALRPPGMWKNFHGYVDHQRTESKEYAGWLVLLQPRHS